MFRTARVIAGPFIRRFRSILGGSLLDKQLLHSPDRQQITIPGSDGIELSGYVYPAASRPAPGLLMIHGSDPAGQLHSFYVALAAAMQSRGFCVLTFNLRGYPGSRVRPEPENFRFKHLVADVEAALAFFQDLDLVDPERVVVFGHSYGAGLVLPVKGGRAAPWKGVLFGPPVWMKERVTQDNAPDREMFHERFWRYMSLERPLPMNVFLDVANGIDVLGQAGALKAGHFPILLMDGAAEGPDVWAYQRLIYERLPQPCDYFTVPFSDHYGNCASFGDLAIWDRRVISTMADYLNAWIRRPLVPDNSHEHEA